MMGIASSVTAVLFNEGIQGEVRNTPLIINYI